MQKPDVSTTVTHVQLISSEVLHVLFTSNDIRENYVSELCEINLKNVQSRKTLFHSREWLTSFRSMNKSKSYVSRWDDIIYEVNDSNIEAIKRDCEVITRIVQGFGEQILCTCYWGLVQWKRKGEWVSLNIGREVDLFAALSESEESFYVCGANGTLVKWTGDSWSFIEIPSDADFLGLARHEDGDIIVCGDGVIFKGQGSEWQELPAPIVTYNFAIAVGPKIYLCGGDKGLFQMEGTEVRAFSSNVYAYHCDAIGDLVVCADTDKVHIFTGSEQFEIVFENIL